MLTPQRLLHDFGSRAKLTRNAVRALFDALGDVDSPALEHWLPLFGRWAGRAVDRLPQHLTRLATRYGIAPDAGNSPRLLFALQTYYALLVRLLAQRFAGQSVDGSLPINPFRWCDSANSPAVVHTVQQLKDACTRYQTVASPLSDTCECDLFKPLYQDLFPRPLRRQLGEYYTPDWLAEHVLDQVGYTGQPGQRLLDPACGSGTFLMLALRRLLRGERGERRGERDGNDDCGIMNDECHRIAHRSSLIPHLSSLIPHHSSFIIHHFPSLPVGFDINPLAVMTARANYLIALASSCCGESGLARLSPFAPRKQRDFLAAFAERKATEGFPQQELAGLLPENQTTPIEVPIYLYDSILGCGEVARAADQPFDFVVGNPPWIAWDNLPEEDRQATKPLWERYGLFSLSGNEARHGGGKKDLSMLMLYAAADRYLKPGGRLGMVITQTLFQTKGAGDGFRRFRLGHNGPPLRVLRVDDMVALRPFGDAANWTSTIILEKGAETQYPVPYVKWERGERGERRGEREGNDECGMMNDECSDSGTNDYSEPSIHHSSFIIHHSLLARPIDPTKPTSPWLVLPVSSPLSTLHSPLSTFPLFPSPRPSPRAPRPYLAHLGANSGGANGVYWVEVLGHRDGGVLIRNLAGRGKHQIEVVETVIEPDLLYPLLRWGDIRRYSAVPSAYLILAQDPATRSGIPESVMQAKYPRTLAYLERFRDLLISRAAYRRYQQAGPFYAMYNVGPYTVAPIKVIWRRMDRQINATVNDRSAGVPPARIDRQINADVNDRSAGVPPATAEVSVLPAATEAGETPAFRRPMIPQETCVLVACDTADEAHYLCALLNSAPINEIVAAHSVRGGKGFGTPGMFDFLPIRRYCAADPRHQELASLSRQSHALPSASLQDRIDEVAQELWAFQQASE
jgi:hypothetical protein